MLPGHSLALHIDDFLTDLANANKPRNTIRAYRGDLTGFASSPDSSEDSRPLTGIWLTSRDGNFPVKAKA